MAIEPGDIIADKTWGHVLKVYKVEEDLIWGFYECNPTTFHRFGVDEVRLLSKTKGVDMGRWNTEEFSDHIKRQLEWAKGVHGLPRKFRETKPKVGKKQSTISEEQLDNMTLEELEELYKKMGG